MQPLYVTVEVEAEVTIKTNITADAVRSDREWPLTITICEGKGTIRCSADGTWSFPNLYADAVTLRDGKATIECTASQAHQVIDDLLKTPGLDYYFDTSPRWSRLENWPGGGPAPDKLVPCYKLTVRKQHTFDAATWRRDRIKEIERLSSYAKPQTVNERLHELADDMLYSLRRIEKALAVSQTVNERLHELTNDMLHSLRRIEKALTPKKGVQVIPC